MYRRCRCAQLLEENSTGDCEWKSGLSAVRKGQPGNPEKGYEDYVQDNTLWASMESVSEVEKNRKRIEKRTAYVTDDIGWMHGVEGSNEV